MSTDVKYERVELRLDREARDEGRQSGKPLNRYDVIAWAGHEGTVVGHLQQEEVSGGRPTHRGSRINIRTTYTARWMWATAEQPLRYSRHFDTRWEALRELVDKHLGGLGLMYDEQVAMAKNVQVLRDAGGAR